MRFLYGVAGFSYLSILLCTSAFGVIAYIQSLNLPFSFIYEVNYLAQPYDMKGYIKGGLFFVSYFLAILGTISIVFIRQLWLAIPLLFLVALAYSLDLFVQLLGSSPNGFTLSVLSLAFSETARAEDILVFSGVLIQAVFYFLCGWAVIDCVAVLPGVFSSFQNPLDINISNGRCCFSGLLVFRVFSITSHSYPAFVKFPVIMAELFHEKSMSVSRSLDKDIVPVNKHSYGTIVWIIDESVSGDYLSINGYEKNTTPYLKSLLDKPYLKNFGVVTPISNCSNTSNLFLRIGLTTTLADDFNASRHTLPTIFEYAHRAGFEVQLVDAQASSGELHNHLTSLDLRHIDHHVNFSRKYLPNERDMQLAKYLRTQLDKDDGVPRLIIAVKWGAHWPYPLAFPKDRTVFTPSATKSFTEMSAENHQIISNAYANALRYTVDDFFREVLSQKLDKGEIIFYTADHGQSLFEQDSSPLTHCHFASDTANLPEGEFKVPLLVFAQQAKQEFMLAPEKTYTQEQLFSTTLKLLGYTDEVYGKHGPTLFEGSALPYSESFVLDSGLKIRFPNSDQN